MTLGELLAWDEFLEDMVQFGWLETPTNSSPLLLFKLSIDYIKNQDGSWIKMMLKEVYISRIVLMTKLFLWMFWEKILIFFKIMLGNCSQLSESRFFYFHKVLVVSCYAICNWIGASRRDTNSSLPNNHLSS